jgi:alpha-1,3-rhamnosyl/mannosyltransferase
MNQHALEAFAGFHGGKLLDNASTLAWLDDKKPSKETPRWLNGSRFKRAARALPFVYSLRSRWQQHQFITLTKPLQNYTYWEPGLALQPFRGKRAATIYDLSHVFMPRSHPPARAKYLTAQIDKTLQSGCKILTISHTMQEEIATYAGLDKALIEVIPPGAGTAFAPLTSAQKKQLQASFSLPENYILILGTREPRKNLAALFTAYSQLPKALRQQWPLVCVGGDGWGNHGAVTNAIARLKQAGELIMMGYVPQHHLPAIVGGAGLLAYPSLYEGFGMPVIEAMACGVPVLTSLNTSMHEIVGSAGFLVDPNDINHISRTLEEALNDSAARDAYAKSGLVISARYTWERSATLLYQALENV